MCVICEKKYSNETTVLICCSNVTEIPYIEILKLLDCSNTKITSIPSLRNLKWLYAINTKIKEIPFLPNLQYLYYSGKLVNEIPFLPKLQRLCCNDSNIYKINISASILEINCSNSSITEIPKTSNCIINSDNCRWLNPNNEIIDNITKIQYFIKSIINKRIRIMHKSLNTHYDLIRVL